MAQVIEQTIKQHVEKLHEAGRTRKEIQEILASYKKETVTWYLTKLKIK